VGTVDKVETAHRLSPLRATGQRADVHFVQPTDTLKASETVGLIQVG